MFTLYTLYTVMSHSTQSELAQLAEKLESVTDRDLRESIEFELAVQHSLLDEKESKRVEVKLDAPPPIPENLQCPQCTYECCAHAHNCPLCGKGFSGHADITLCG
jgi:hypothetical protein